MSWTHVLTTSGFWVGFPSGALITGVVAPIITARSVRASDRRKSEQEDKVQARREEREDKLRDHESLYSAALEFARHWEIGLTELLGSDAWVESAAGTGSLDSRPTRRLVYVVCALVS